MKLIILVLIIRLLIRWAETPAATTNSNEVNNTTIHPAEYSLR